MPKLNDGCSCGKIRYQLTLDSLDDSKTTLCHCSACKVAMGGAFGLTAKTPNDMFKYFGGGSPKLYIADSGVHREFCDTWGAFICEYGEGSVDKFRYIMTGTLDDGPDALTPKGEIFTSQRCKWMPQIPDTFQKKKITQ